MLQIKAVHSINILFKITNLAKTSDTLRSVSDPVPILLVSNRYYIRNMTLLGQHIDLLAQDLNNAVALDFHWEDQKIYWSDVTSSGSSISSRNVTGGEKTVSWRYILTLPRS